MLSLKEKYVKVIKVLSIISLSCSFIILLPICFGFAYKSYFLKLLGFIAVYLLILIAFFYGLKKIRIKKRAARIAFKSLLFYPAIITFALFTALVLFLPNNVDSEEIFQREEYMVERKMEWSDNLKEFGTITIYKEVKYLPFLYRKIYEDKGYNTHIEKVYYNKGNRTMELTLSNGSDGMWKRSWIETVSLD